MTTHPLDALNSACDDTVDLGQLADAAGMTLDDLRELIEYGALRPLVTLRAEPVFPIACMAPLRIAEKLRRDYDLDLFVVVIVMDYLSRIEHLESQVRALQATSLHSHGL